MPPEERELDALIDQKLFGHDVVWMPWGGGKVLARKGQRDFGIPAIVPGYHMKISDAWKVVEELSQRGVSLCITSNVSEAPKDEKYQVGIWNVGAQRLDPPAYGKTAPEAICRAALTVLGPNA